MRKSINVKGTELLFRDKIDKIADRLAEELAKKMFYEFLLFKHLPEIEKIKKGEIKALKNEEAREFLRYLI